MNECVLTECNVLLNVLKSSKTADVVSVPDDVYNRRFQNGDCTM